MTPARWRRTEELLAGAIQVEPAGLASWPRQANGGDQELRAQVGRLLDNLDNDEREEGRGCRCSSISLPRDLRQRIERDRGGASAAAW